MAGDRKKEAGKRSVPAKPSGRGKPRAVKATAAAAQDGPGFPIVGVGASAGGVEALKELLGALPENPGLALVVVQHLSAEHESLLPNLLKDVSKVSVVRAADGMALEINQVYVMPPGVQMEVDGKGHLRLRPRPDGAPGFMPINHFFSSLAQQVQERAIGVVLSGTGSDGAQGLRDIKAGGGIALVQEPSGAAYAGMPQAALATGVVDEALSTQELAGELVRISQHLPLAQGGPAADETAQARPRRGQAAPQDQPERDLSDEEIREQIFELLRQVSGVDFRNYKPATIGRRMQRRMILHRVDSLEQYLRLLREDPSAVHSLYQDLLIHVTSFFREPASFEALSKAVVPKVLAEKKDGAVRVWVPGCASGEEVYSVAISLLERLGESPWRVQVQIFGTDISDLSIDQARQGVYPASIASNVSAERLRRFFTPFDKGFQVTRSLRDLCIFARQDLTRDPPFSRLDLVVCRNVLIYLGPEGQRRVLNLFHFALNPEGFLMLGSAETVGASSDLFRIVDKRYRLYSNKALPRAKIAPLPPRFETLRLSGGGPAPAAHPTNNRDQDLLAQANRLILERHGPPGVIVDGDLRILHFRGQTGLYLEAAPGQPSMDLLKMARPGLLYPLRSAIAEARKRQRAARREKLSFQVREQMVMAHLEVIPLQKGDNPPLLVLFEKAVAAPPPAPPRRRRRRRAAARRRRRRASTAGPASCSRSLTPTGNISSPSFRIWRPPTRNCRGPTKRSSPPTRNCRRPMRNWTPPARNCSPPTKRSTPSTRNCTAATPN